MVVAITAVMVVAITAVMVVAIRVILPQTMKTKRIAKRIHLISYLAPKAVQL
jgi:hypothetical protein